MFEIFFPGFFNIAPGCKSIEFHQNVTFSVLKAQVKQDKTLCKIFIYFKRVVSGHNRGYI